MIIRLDINSYSNDDEILNLRLEGLEFEIHNLDFKISNI